MPILSASRAAFGLLFLMSLSVLSAQTKGQLTVGGKAVPLTNVYAYQTKGFFDDKKNDTVVILSDAPVTDAVARDSFDLSKQASTGKLHFVKVVIDTKGQIINFSVGHNAFKIAPGGGSTEHQFTSKVNDGKNISGTVFTTSPQEGFGDGPKYEYKVEFTAAVQPRK